MIGAASRKSKAEIIAALPEAERKSFFDSLTDEEFDFLLTDWEFWARPDQLPPQTDWSIWLALAGRGWGKTRVGAEITRKRIEKCPRIALIGRTTSDVRDIMIEGESGLLSVFPKDKKPIYQPNKSRVVFHNGAIGYLYSSKEPDQLRGPQHHFAWGDELAAWYYPQETYDNLMFGLRLGDDPQVVFTTTPRPIDIIKDMLTDETCHVTKGNTFENIANLPPAYVDRVVKRYEGTTIGRQELFAEVLTDVEGALWKQANIDETRINLDELPELEKVVIGVDPATTTNKNSDETGIVAVGSATMPDGKKHGFILDDVTLKASPRDWAEKVVAAYHDYQANRVVGETNQGGDMVAYTIETVDASVPVRGVHAARGKKTRAEPIASLYEQKRIHHVGQLPQLESQMTTWNPEKEDSPDRVDAMVWGLWDLLIDEKGPSKPRAASVKTKRRR